MLDQPREARETVDASQPRSSGKAGSAAADLQSLWGISEHSYLEDWLFETGDDDEDDLDGVTSDAPNRKFSALSRRCIINIGTLVLLTVSLILIFVSYPLAVVRDIGTRSLIGANGTGQIADIPNIMRLIDPKTPIEARTWTKPLADRSSFHLVFSDEFETEGRTFWPGDDPFWEAVDLHYAGTEDYEWYTPEAVNTSRGFLNIALEEHATRGRNFRSGMLQSWNKFCFQGGYIEVSVILPGSRFMSGLWPAIWTMGNLGRPGYLGSTHGMWPYSYSSCDVGILPNQTWLNKTGPPANLERLTKTGVPLSHLDGMRTPACTCPDEDHPGPTIHVGRSAPELDIVEVLSTGGIGTASQSFQLGPFDADYNWTQSAPTTVLHQNSTTFNPWPGGPFQESISGLTPVPNDAFEHDGGRATTFAIDFEPDWLGDGSGHVTWYVDGKPTWTVTGKAIGPRADVEVGQRLIPVEPLALVINLGLSPGWNALEWDKLRFPATLRVDYVRVYQRDGRPDRITCDPPDHPTARYIQDHMDIYTDSDLAVFPRDAHR
ncbi:related to KRE6 - glucan synthase subunit [Pseudozyma flocculosa]|nr:related to KRE6 - glucan synthase subunit [Pseudozyma flocculosa]